MCHVLDIDRDVVIYLYYGIFDVREVLDEAKAANHVLNLVNLNRAGSDIDVRHLDSHEDIVKRNPIGPHGIGVHVDLVFPDKSTDGGDLADASCTHKRIAYVPVLNGAKFVEVPAACRLLLVVEAFERVPEDLSQGSGVRAECRLDALG